MPLWIMVMGGVGIGIGVIALAKNVMSTMGARITLLTPSRGYSAQVRGRQFGVAAITGLLQIGTAGTVLLASSLGVPVSSTHTMVGAVTGIALVPTQLNTSINYATLRKIVVSWVVTLPIGAITTATIFYINTWIVEKLVTNELSGGWSHYLD